LEGANLREWLAALVAEKKRSRQQRTPRDT
jgi:hypothetical protein